MEEPTRGVIKDAAIDGFYEIATGKKFPRVQLLTMDGLLSGKRLEDRSDRERPDRDDCGETRAGLEELTPRQGWEGEGVFIAVALFGWSC